MALPNGPVARVIRSARDDRLTVAQLIAELEELPPYYPTEIREVRVDHEEGYRTVRFHQ